LGALNQEATLNLNRMQAEINNLGYEISALVSEIEGSYDISEIEAQAPRLGLSRPMPHQIININMNPQAYIDRDR
jgi:hypothetical protein